MVKIKNWKQIKDKTWLMDWENIDEKRYVSVSKMGLDLKGYSTVYYRVLVDIYDSKKLNLYDKNDKTIELGNFDTMKKAKKIAISYMKKHP